MPKRSSKPKPNVDETAAAITRFIAGEGPKPEPPEPKVKNPAAVALGRLGGLKGGRARAASLSKTKRSEIAKKAAKARWSNKADLGGA